MAWRNDPVDMGYDDDDMLDRMENYGGSPPSHPYNLRFTLAEEDLDKAAGPGDIGNVMRFSAMGEVTSCHLSKEGNRIELILSEFAGDDGKFFDLSRPAYISFCDFELGRMKLDCDCEVGDMIHLIGEARLDDMHRAEYGSSATLQIVKLVFEDESEEARAEE